MIIYKTTNLITGKFYIGKDKNNDPKYLGSGLHLKRALKKYGKENFLKEILEYCTDFDHLNEREIYWIAKLNAVKEGYNITEGGNGGRLFGKDNGMFGKNHTEESRAKMSKKAKDMFTNKENHPMYGRKHTSETKNKISKNQPEQSGKNSGVWLGYIKITDTNGDIKIYETAREAAEDLDVNAGKLYIRAKTKTTYKRNHLAGYKFQIIKKGNKKGICPIECGDK